MQTSEGNIQISKSKIKTFVVSNRGQIHGELGLSMIVFYDQMNFSESGYKNWSHDKYENGFRN